MWLDIYSEVNVPSRRITLNLSDVLAVQDVDKSSVSRLLLVAIVP
jgi:hypothetical protein